MKGRNILAGLSLVALASCGDIMSKERSWIGQLPSVPGYAIDVSQRTREGRVTENALRIGILKENKGYKGLIYAVDGNGNGRFTDIMDNIRFIIDNDTDPILDYAHPLKLATILKEALPNAINNPAYK